MKGTECSPGRRHMTALAGAETSFDQGGEPLDLLAGIEVTGKAVERHAEAIVADIAIHEHRRLAVPNNWNCPWRAPLWCRSSTSKWTAPACPW